MRVLIAGSANEREWLRRLLADAGVEIAVDPDGADVVVEISSTAHKPGAAYGSVEPGVAYVPDWKPEPLTPRERDVLALLAEGLPNKGIAAALDISDQTVKFHVAAIIGKLGASNRTDAVRRAVRSGLVTL
jgi:DNA-binding NarL/FixJ family response regulator